MFPYLYECPNEIWGLIFDVACRDPRTGRVLALVSRRFNAFSKTYRLISVDLTSTAQLHAFLNVLTKVPPWMRTTRYLYLTLPTPTSSLEETSALYDALSLVSGTLEVLTICYAAPFAFKFEDQFPALPKLAHLSVYLQPYSFIGRIPPRNDLNGVPGIKFPSLRELQVFGSLSFAPYAYWKSFHSSAPKLVTVIAWTESGIRLMEDLPKDLIGTRSPKRRKTMVEESRSTWMKRVEMDHGTFMTSTVQACRM